MVRALDRLAAAASPSQSDVPAVAADVDEAAELAVAVADEDDRDVPGPAATKLPGSATWSAGPAYCHGAREDPLLLEPEHGRVGVPVVRQRADDGGRSPTGPIYRPMLTLGRPGSQVLV